MDMKRKEKLTIVQVFCFYGTGVPTTEQLVYSGVPQSSVPTFNTGYGDGTVNLRSLKVSQVAYKNIRCRNVYNVYRAVSAGLV